MDQFWLFIQDRWLFMILAIIGIFFAMKILKTLIKWVVILAIVAAIIIYYGANY